MTKKEGQPRDITVNRRAFHEYAIGERFEAGLSLVGSEVKSLRAGRAQLQDAYARFFGNELYLVGAHIAPYAPSGQFGHAPTRDRKLLLHRRELDKLASRIQEKGLTLVPLRFYWEKGRAKCELGLGRGKKLHDKRAAIRERDERREMERARGARRTG
ncbi:MAG TPA: SsrA-binding protein SmpB [Candidatus Limnocylindria bacterium]|nr:SsrA-binding protein SmpB [Candidatus Limnocylindria bacterium]